jgi:hypothetical protein
MLRLDTPGGRSLNLRARGDELRLELPELRELRTIVPRTFRGRGRAIGLFANVLRTHGLRLSLESGGRLIIRFGHGVAPSWLARLLGLSPAYVPLSAVGLLFRR